MNRQAPMRDDAVEPAPEGSLGIDEQLIEEICQRLRGNKRVRRSLPSWGRLHIDRNLPFLCVYRRPLVGVDAGTDKLVSTEASYLTAPGVRQLRPSLLRLIRAIAQTQAEQFGAFLLLELWAESGKREGAGASVAGPVFKIVTRPDNDLGPVVDRFDAALSRIRIAGEVAKVEIATARRCGPPQLPPLLSTIATSDPWCRVLGLEIRPIYRAAGRNEVYPLVLREFRRALTRALRPTLFEFVRTCTTNQPEHFHVLGRRAVVKSVWETDRLLAEVSESFDFLLQVTPVDPEQSWREFRSNRFEAAPRFRYRPVPLDPVLLKRRLYQTPIERVEDPALLQLMRQKQDEVDRQITMLLDLNTPRFLQGSLQVYGGVDDKLLRLAQQIMERCPPRARDDTRGGYLSVLEFVRRAEAEIDYYRGQWPEVNGQVQVRSDIGNVLMVSRGSFLVGDRMRVPAVRAEALIQHEIGTHVVTYFNGLAQPLRLLHAGLAGYDALQEGLAVLAEHLVGGLSRPRLRLLAARVLGVRDLIDGATFVDVFRRLYHNYGFEQRIAFTITRRIFRGGGLTKDAAYLRGFQELLAYTGKGRRIEPLFVGKIAAEHIPIVRELQWREILRAPPLTPRFMKEPEALARLEGLRGKSAADLVEGKR